ncbi:MAG: hypothetical protein KFW21_04815, partial [Spirochaetota bacterium]|nr:hypothetical protein [Spirochaetota bacterium]
EEASYEEEVDADYGEEASYEEEVDADYGEEASYEEEVDADNNAPEAGATTVIKMPLYQDYRLPMVVDPKNPKLPANHKISKLRGTVWRGNEVVIRTNKNGALAEYRPFIFFDTKEDAIAYKYLSIDQQKLPDFPRMNNYMVLNPLLQTNNYIPMMAVKADPLRNIALDKRIDFTVNPIVLNNQSYVAALEKIRLQEEENNKSKDIITVNTNIMENIIEFKAETPIEEFSVTTNRSLSILTNVISSDETQNMQQKYSLEKSEYSFSTDEYPSQDVGDQLGFLQFSPLYMIAQNINQATLDPDQYVINVGGDNSGIFVHETGDIINPYKVIFLALDDAMNLYEYTVENTFDVRDSTSGTSQTARELYLRILDEKISMKQFQKVRMNRDYLD